jgi:hypothetical protein
VLLTGRKYAHDVKTSDRGSALALVVGLAALVVAVTALVVAVTRNPHSSTAVPTPTSTTLETPSVSPAGTVSTSKAGTVLQVIGLVRIPIDHVGHYSWVGPTLTIPGGALQPNGLPEHMAASFRIEGNAQLRRGISVRPVEDLRRTRRSPFGVTFDVVSFTGRPDVLVAGANISTVHR